MSCEPRVNLSLRSVVVEVGYQANTQRVSAVPPLNDAQVTSRLRQTLPEA